MNLEKKKDGLFTVLLNSYLSCWLEEQIVKLPGRLLFCTFAKDGGWEVNMGESLNEKTKKQLVDGIATFKSQAARSRYIFFLWKKNLIHGHVLISKKNLTTIVEALE